MSLYASCYVTFEGVEYHVEGSFSSGRAAVGPAYAHGGLPAEGPELQDVTVTVADTGADANHMMNVSKFDTLAVDALYDAELYDPNDDTF